LHLVDPAIASRGGRIVKSHCIILSSAAVVGRLPTKIARRPLGDQTLKGLGFFEVYRLGLDS
jgi:hypothetical protein